MAIQHDISSAIAQCQCLIRVLVDLEDYDPLPGLVKWGVVTLHHRGVVLGELQTLPLFQQWRQIRLRLEPNEYAQLIVVLQKLKGE